MKIVGFPVDVSRSQDGRIVRGLRTRQGLIQATLDLIQAGDDPAVAEAAVVPSPDPVRHAVPKAFVTLAPGYEPSADVARSILEYARDALAPYKRIRLIEFSDLPKTISGKIRRVDLRALEEQRRASGERGPREFSWDELFADM